MSDIQRAFYKLDVAKTAAVRFKTKLDHAEDLIRKLSDHVRIITCSVNTPEYVHTQFITMSVLLEHEGVSKDYSMRVKDETITLLCGQKHVIETNVHGIIEYILTKTDHRDFVRKELVKKYSQVTGPISNMSVKHVDADGKDQILEVCPMSSRIKVKIPRYRYEWHTKSSDLIPFHNVKYDRDIDRFSYNTLLYEKVRSLSRHNEFEFRPISKECDNMYFLLSMSGNRIITNSEEIYFINLKKSHKVVSDWREIVPADMAKRIHKQIKKLFKHEILA